MKVYALFAKDLWQIANRNARLISRRWKYHTKTFDKYLSNNNLETTAVKLRRKFSANYDLLNYHGIIRGHLKNKRKYTKGYAKNGFIFKPNLPEWF